MTGHIFAICGPSGAGKGTLINRLFEDNPNFVIPDSYTTRPKRVNEGTRKTYHFVSEAEFMQAFKAGKILEYEREHNYLYGTDKESLDRALSTSKTIIFDIETRGVLTLKKKFEQAVTVIFITTKSLETLRGRLQDDPRRANMNEAELNTRLKTAKEEVKFIPQADFVIYNENDEIESSYRKFDSIIQAKIQA